MKYVLSAMLIVAGVIHLLPLSGVLGGERLASLYGIRFDDPNLAILMRHRAVLFGLLGGFLVCAAFKPSFQLAALIGGFISVLSFLYLAWAVGGYNDQVARVFVADIVALACLVIGGIAYVLVHRQA
jgi:hypothetical protein